MGHWKLQSYFLLSNEVKKPSRLATNVNKQQEFMWKLGGYIIQFYFLNKLAVWEPGYNFREGSNSPLHGPDWTHFNEKMPVHWNWLIPRFLASCSFSSPLGIPTQAFAGKRGTACAHVASEGPCWLSQHRPWGSAESRWCTLSISSRAAPRCPLHIPSRDRHFENCLLPTYTPWYAGPAVRHFWLYKHTLVSSFSGLTSESLGAIAVLLDYISCRIQVLSPTAVNYRPGSSFLSTFSPIYKSRTRLLKVIWLDLILSVKSLHLNNFTFSIFSIRDIKYEKHRKINTLLQDSYCSLYQWIL